MVDRKVRKASLAWIIRIGIFVAFIVLLWQLLYLAKPYIESIAASFINDTAAKIFASVLPAFIDLVLSAVITPFVSKRIELLITPTQKIPKILISMPQNNVSNVSGAKTTHSCLSGVCINIGSVQTYFHVVYAKIKNIGESAITKISINEKELNLALEQNQDSTLFFIVSESLVNRQGVKNIVFPYCVEDDQGDFFEGTYCMQIDKDKIYATFQPKNKLRRRKK